MQKVYKHKETGDLYVIASGELSWDLDMAGQRTVTIEPAYTVIDTVTGQANTETGAYRLLQAIDEDIPAHRLVLTKALFKKEFEAVPKLRNIHNTPIETLMRQYEEECCDFSNKKWLLAVARHSVYAHDDGLSRCIMHALANELERQIQQNKTAAGLTGQHS